MMPEYPPPAEAPAVGREDARSRAAQIARNSYGRLLSIIAARTGDIELAEDALGDALLEALCRWPEQGIPSNPEAWILTVARNRGRDVLKSAHHNRSLPLAAAERKRARDVLEEFDPEAIPDDRLGLLFACAHPAIDPAARTPVMLQVVLGLDARLIARAFNVRHTTMAQRLVRAKRRIRNTGIPLAIPGQQEMHSRLLSVLEAIYGAYAADHWLTSAPEVRETLAAEALELATLLATQLPEEPEALGLAALISLSMARTGGRCRAGVYIPLSEQDPADWDADLIARGERYLRQAAPHRRFGRFQLEAAIQSAHCARLFTGGTDWRAIVRLYEALLQIAPSLGAQVGHAAALARYEGAAAGLEALDALPAESARRFQPAWATRAHLLALLERQTEASIAYDRAIALSTEPPIRRYLQVQRAQLNQA